MPKFRRVAGRLGRRAGACVVAAAAGVATLAAPAAATTPDGGATGLHDRMMPADSPDAVATRVAAGTTAGTQAGAVVAPLGVDTSHWQHANSAPIDWAKVAASGQKFAIVKATELYTDGSGNPVLFTDPYVHTDLAAAHAAGLVVSAYTFAHPENSAIAQADDFAGAIGTLPAGSLPPVLDLEVSGGLTVPQLVSWTHTFLDRLEADTHVLPMIYTGPNFWATYLGNDTGFSRYPLWEAHYTTAVQPRQIGGWATYTLWQFTSSATVPGIGTVVDQDRFNASTGATLSNLHRPTGWLDSARADGTGRVTVAGWALDPDTPTTPTKVAVSLDGHVTTVTADATRTDVGGVYPEAGSQHGFTAQLQAGPGSHRVCAYAVDTSTAAVSSGLRCLTVTVTPGLPYGSLDSARADHTGRLTVSGWVIDPDTPTTPATVAVSVDGHVTTVVANATRTDVGRHFPSAGNQHGYTARVQVGLGQHQVCASAIDTSFSSLRKALRCVSVTVTPRLPFGSLDSARVRSGLLTVSGWAIDPDTPATATTVVFYLDGHWASTLANRTRTDVGRVFPAAGAQHGYASQFRVAGGTHKVCAYALDTSFPSRHTTLRCLTTS